MKDTPRKAAETPRSADADRVPRKRTLEHGRLGDVGVRITADTDRP